MHGSRGEYRGSRSKGFLKNTGRDPTQEAIGPKWSNCFSMEVRTSVKTLIRTLVKIAYQNFIFSNKTYVVREVS